MGLTEIIVIGFLAILGVLAFIKSSYLLHNDFTSFEEFSQTNE